MGDGALDNRSANLDFRVEEVLPTLPGSHEGQAPFGPERQHTPLGAGELDRCIDDPLEKLLQVPFIEDF